MFQHHLYVEFISLSWNDIPEFVVPIVIFLMGFAASNEGTEQWARSGQAEVITTMVFIILCSVL